MKQVEMVTHNTWHTAVILYSQVTIKGNQTSWINWDYKERIHAYLITQKQKDNTEIYKNGNIK